jgi:hypothetical protein
MKRNITRELACRAGDGLEVVLLWREVDNRLTISVADWSTGDSLELPARPENALDVFRHPFAYASRAAT